MGNWIWSFIAQSIKYRNIISLRTVPLNICSPLKLFYSQVYLLMVIFLSSQNRRKQVNKRGVQTATRSHKCRNCKFTRPTAITSIDQAASIPAPANGSRLRLCAQSQLLSARYVPRDNNISQETFSYPTDPHHHHLNSSCVQLNDVRDGQSVHLGLLTGWWGYNMRPSPQRALTTRALQNNRSNRPASLAHSITSPAQENSIRCQPNQPTSQCPGRITIPQYYILIWDGWWWCSADGLNEV